VQETHLAERDPVDADARDAPVVFTTRALGLKNQQSLSIVVPIAVEPAPQVTCDTALAQVVDTGVQLQDMVTSPLRWWDTEGRVAVVRLVA
jgi:hypothetical protein